MNYEFAVSFEYISDPGKDEAELDYNGDSGAPAVRIPVTYIDLPRQRSLRGTLVADVDFRAEAEGEAAALPFTMQEVYKSVRLWVEAQRFPGEEAAGAGDLVCYSVISHPTLRQRIDAVLLEGSAVPRRAPVHCQWIPAGPGGAAAHVVVNVLVMRSSGELVVGHAPFVVPVVPAVGAVGSARGALARALPAAILRTLLESPTPAQLDYVASLPLVEVRRTRSCAVLEIEGVLHSEDDDDGSGGDGRSGGDSVSEVGIVFPLLSVGEAVAEAGGGATVLITHHHTKNGILLYNALREDTMMDAIADVPCTRLYPL